MRDVPRRLGPQLIHDREPQRIDHQAGNIASQDAGRLATAADMHFGTRDAWLDVIREWARRVPEVDKVWIFGSRATGVRRAKDGQTDEPDIDIAYTLRGSDFGSLLSLVTFDGEKWRGWLQRRIPASVHHEFAAPDDAIVWPAVQTHGLLIYVADD